MENHHDDERDPGGVQKTMNDSRNVIPATRLAAQSETRNDFLIALRSGVFQIIEKLAALIDHLQQPAALSVVTLVSGEMLAQIINACREQRDLHFR